MLISTSSRQILYHTQGSISHWSHMHQSYLLLGLPTRPTLFRKFPTLASSLIIRWSNVTPEMENIWQLAFYTGVMLLPRRSMQPLLHSRPKRLSNSSTGAPLVSRLVFAFNHLSWFPMGIWQKLIELCMYFLTQICYSICN